MTNLPGNRPGFTDRTGPDTCPVSGPDTGSLTDSSHVRAIASRPVPSLPDLSRPNPGAIPHNRDQQLNGNNRLSAVNAEVAGARAAAVAKWCWACDCQTRNFRWCETCGAPPWDGRVVDDLIDGAGVYVIESACGLAKIGMSRKGVAGRVEHLITRAANAGTRCWHVACLPDAGYSVERYLHVALAETRDRSWAESEGLPHPSEWFWPSPALRRLVAGDAFADALTPELIGGLAA